MLATLLAELRTRVLGSPRTSIIGLLVLLAAGLLAAGAQAIEGLTAEVQALTGLVQALANGWQAFLAVPVAAWFLGRRDGGGP